MKAKFMFSLICVAAVTLTACEEYPYGYYSHGGYYSPYGYGGGGYGGGYGYPYGGYRYGYGYPYGGYGYPTVGVAVGRNGHYGGSGYGRHQGRGTRVARGPALGG